MPTVHLLDYAAGNIRSLVNAVEKLGWEVEWIRSPEDVEKADKLILPGVGHFGHCLTQFANAGYVDPVRKHIQSGKPFMGICVGLQALFETSAENPNVPGLGVVKGRLERFDDSEKSVPHIGWNSANTSSDDEASKSQSVYGLRPESKYYYVHSFAVPYRAGELEKDGWTVATAKYGSEEFIGAIAKDNILATQFHPEKSGAAGQRGDLVVTKGDQYDVREKSSSGGNDVRNLGKPVSKAQEYYEQGADEVTFLNITSFRDTPLKDLPMLEVLRQASATVFVPLTIGGGIRDTVDPETGRTVPALEVATLYFQSGADKVSIGSDACDAAEEYLRAGKKLSGKTAIESISEAYGAQAVVVSIDPKRVYVESPSATTHNTVETSYPGPNGEKYCWYACTAKGGRETRDLDVVQLATAVEAMGAGELLLNCIDKDGTNSGFDLELIRSVKGAVRIPVIASSGAGNAGHFAEVFEKTPVDAALGAGMFHRGEWTVKQVKEVLEKDGLVVRPFEQEI
ncbi:hypothetical protein Q7P36_003664 [Cladosporium allicinum]